MREAMLKKIRRNNKMDEKNYDSLKDFAEESRQFIRMQRQIKYLSIAEKLVEDIERQKSEFDEAKDAYGDCT
jgi:hypothetical protein